jgi:branched-chain amino acid transport system permease protein
VNVYSSVVGLALIVTVAFLVPVTGSAYATGLALSLAMWIALAESWILFSGLTGYFYLGHVVFYGIGAYVCALLAGLWPIWAVLSFAGISASAFALAIGYPALRVRGPYFVMLSLGLAELVKHVVLNIEVKLGEFSRLIIGGPRLEALYYVMLAFALCSVALAFFVRRSRFGYALRAIRENEEAAETVGIPVARFKLTAFALSALIPGAVGALMVLRSTYFEAAPAFDPFVSFTIVTIAVIGGSDDVRGPFLGALFLVGLSELLWANAPHVYMTLVGALLVGFALFAPDGIVGRFVTQRSSYGNAAAA